MKTLILARHAKSDWQHAGLADHDRPLNRRGQHDAPRMGAHLAAHYPAPQRILSSTALRAASTAAILADALGIEAGAIEHLRRLYLADARTLLGVARALPDHLDTVMLVAHNPGMTDLVNLLSDAGLDNLPTCGVARIGFEVADWSALTPGDGRLLSLDLPKGLPAA